MKRFFALFALFTGACTFTPQGDSLHAKFHPPFTSQTWHMEHGLWQGQRVCALSSGYGGITVRLRREKGSVAVAVLSNRDMEPGETLTITVNGQRFETSDATFSTADAPAIAEKLSEGGKAYLEWSELRSGVGNPRQHVTGIINLTGFKAQLEQCETNAGGKKS